MATVSTNCGLVIPEATRFIVDRDLMVYISHDISGIFNSKEGQWLSDNCLLKYQSLLLERPITQLKNCSALNPATFLSESLDKKQNHACYQVLALNWRREWQPTPVFLPGESHGQRSPVGCSPWGSTESDTAEAT